MANRNFYPERGSLHREVVRLYGNFTIGSSGAVSSSSARGFSVAKTGSETGRYTLTLEDKYYAFLGANVTVEQADDAAITVVSAGVRNVDATTSVDVQFVDEALADANPASGDVIHVELVMHNAANV